MSFQRLLPALLLLASAPLHADVLVVELPQAGVYLDLQEAIDDAPEGATLLLGQGELDAFTIQAKSLTLVSPSPLAAKIDVECVIRNLGPQQQVVLRGLEIVASPEAWYPSGEALGILDCQGTVRLEDCRLVGGLGPPEDVNDYGNGGEGLQVQSSFNVALSNCSIEGGAGGSSGEWESVGGSGGAGIQSVGSQLAVYSTTVAGGQGGTAFVSGGLGGTGLHLDGGNLFAAGSTFLGGDGGDATDILVSGPGRGGDGLFADVSAQLRLLDNAYQGGEGGDSVDGPAADGQDRLWQGGALSDLPGTARGLTAENAVAASDEGWILHFEGEPGDEVRLALSSAHGFRPSRNPLGVWLVPFPAQMPFQPQGIVPASGVLQLVLPSPQLLDTAARRFTVQAFVRNGGASQPLSSSLQVLSLDPSAFPDCDGSGRIDIAEIAEGTLTDCDGDLVPDNCQSLPDCNGNGIPDSIDIECFGLADENGDGIPDPCQNGQVLVVDALAAPGGDGSQAAPFSNLADAVDAALSEAIILVRAGLYAGPENRNLDFGMRGIQLIGESGPAHTIIDCMGQAQAFYQSGLGPFSPIRVEGLTLVDGYAGNSSPAFGQGGAARLRGPAEFVNCRFERCRATGEGGALAAELTPVAIRLRQCTFVENESGQFGGAVSGHVRASRCVFDNNIAGAEGGAVSGGGILAHSIFRSNSAESGGAVEGSFLVDNSIFAFNQASWGGVHSGFATSSSFTSCTFVDNTAVQSGSVFSLLANDVQVSNSILWNQASPVVVLRQGFGPGHFDISFSNIQGGAAAIDVESGTLDYGPGNLEQDPLFQAPHVGDYRLGAGSPCLDAGRVSLLAADLLDVDGDGHVSEEVPLDLVLNPRRIDDAAPDSGDGSAPLPDMGALERN